MEHFLKIPQGSPVYYQWNYRRKSQARQAAEFAYKCYPAEFG